MQDLINRMLQPNPVKRISLQEIQEHVWYSRDLPEYLHFINKLQINNKNAQIDTTIVNELFRYNPNIGKSFDEVCQDILNKRNTDYCGAYELIKHDKLKKECFKDQASNKGPHGSQQALYNNSMRSARSEKSNASMGEKSKRKQGRLRSVHTILTQELAQGGAGMAKLDPNQLLEQSAGGGGIRQQ